MWIEIRTKTSYLAIKGIVVVISISIIIQAWQTIFPMKEAHVFFGGFKGETGENI